MPVMISGGLFWWDSMIRPRPASSRRAPRAAKRCGGLGCAGRAERAATIGVRAALRAGHQAAVTAVVTASSIATRIAHQGRWNRSMRCSAMVSSRGLNANHPARPTVVPVMAATAPTTAPLASRTSRMCRSPAPIAPSIPRARRRRWAITVKPATANRPTNSSPMVASTSTLIVALAASAGGRISTCEPCGRVAAANCCAVAWIRMVTWSGGLACPGATRANLSSRFNGFSTRPTTCQSWPLSCQVPPMCRLKMFATAAVTAISFAPPGYRPASRRSIGRL